MAALWKSAGANLFPLRVLPRCIADCCWALLQVEAVSDFADVSDDDLSAMGMKKIEKNRFFKALQYA